MMSLKITLLQNVSLEILIQLVFVTINEMFSAG